MTTIKISEAIKWLSKQPSTEIFGYYNNRRENGELGGTCLFSLMVQDIFQDRRLTVAKGGEISIEGTADSKIGVIPFHDAFWNVAVICKGGVKRDKAISILRSLAKTPLFQEKLTPDEAQKYTIVYSEFGFRGSMHYSIVKFEHVETDDLATLISQEPYDGNIHFIFPGHVNPL